MNKKLLKYNNFEQDYLEWAYEYFAYKLHTFDKDNVSDSFDVIEAEESLKDRETIDELHEAVRDIANLGLGQISNLSIGIKKFYYYAKFNEIESLDKIDENLINDFINIECINKSLAFGTRSNYKNGIVGLFTFIMNETTDDFKIDVDSITVVQLSESKRNTKKLIDWMNMKMIAKANKDIVKYPFETEFEKCRDILIFRLFCFTGIEPTELKKLKRDNFVLENGDMILRIDATSSRPERSIDMPKAFLIRYFNKYNELREHETDLFFYNHKNKSKPLTSNFITDVVKNVLDFAKIKVRDKTPRMLRKSLAINLNNEKNPETGLTMPEKNIQEIMGIQNRSELREILMLNSLDVLTASKHFLSLKIN